MQQHKKIVHGRKKGRPLGKDRQAAISNVLPLVDILPETLPQDHTLPPSSLFKDRFKSFWFEIGFGSGEHLAGRMAQNPDTGYLGAEPFINGVAGLVQKIEHGPKNNVRIFRNDGMILARSLTPGSIDGIYVLNPDPWHKKRHHKRRLVRTENLDVFAKILRPGGQLILSTDVPDLADWMITQTALHPAFAWTAKTAADWKTPPQGWITTRYETKKARASHKMAYMVFTKKPI